MLSSTQEFLVRYTSIDNLSSFYKCFHPALVSLLRIYDYVLLQTKICQILPLSTISHQDSFPGACHAILLDATAQSGAAWEGPASLCRVATSAKLIRFYVTKAYGTR